MGDSNEQIENMLNKIGETGEKRVVSANIFSDQDIRQFLYYRSCIMNTMELHMELNHLINSNLHTTYDDLPSVFKYDKVPERKVLMASWYDGEDESKAFRRTDTHYIVEDKPNCLNGIVTFEDKDISRDPLYIYVTGRFGSDDENSEAKYQCLYRIHSTSLRDIIMYVLKDKDHKKLGIQLE
jgi:hypothetical protein